jgi:hypothetical protein
MTPEYEMWKAKYDKEQDRERRAAEYSRQQLEAILAMNRGRLQMWDQMERERQQRVQEWHEHAPPWWDVIGWIKRWLHGAPT